MGHGQSVACRHLCGVYQSGIAGFATRIRMAHHEPGSERAGGVGRRHLRGDFHVHDRLGAAFGPNDIEIRGRQGHRRFGGVDCGAWPVSPLPRITGCCWPSPYHTALARAEWMRRSITT